MYFNMILDTVDGKRQYRYNNIIQVQVYNIGILYYSIYNIPVLYISAPPVPCFELGPWP